MLENREVSFTEEIKPRPFRAKDGTLREVKLVECPRCERVIRTSLAIFKCRECFHYYNTAENLSDVKERPLFIEVDSYEDILNHPIGNQGFMIKGSK